MYGPFKIQNSCLVFVKSSVCLSIVCYVQGSLCLVFVMSKVCYVYSWLCLLFVMSRICYVYGMLYLGFVKSKVCYVQGQFCLEFVTSKVCLSSVCLSTVCYGTKYEYIINHIVKNVSPLRIMAQYSLYTNLFLGFETPLQLWKAIVHFISKLLCVKV